MGVSRALGADGSLPPTQLAAWRACSSEASASTISFGVASERQIVSRRGPLPATAENDVPKSGHALSSTDLT
jgi:hypothetical protein